MNQSTLICVVVPCYNEEPVLYETARQIKNVMDELIKKQKIDKKSFIYFVDDGSNDKTWDIIKKLHLEDKERYKGLKLSRNVGHQNALMAGLEAVHEEVDCAISMDADLQDDVSAVVEMIDKFKEGYEIVYGVRKSREKDSFFKRYSAIFFYKLMTLFKVNVIHDHADFRLLSRRVIEHLISFREVNLFLRALIPLIGFKSTNVYYDRKERLAGVSKYPFKKMLSFALDGITSFSITPLRFITLSGFIIFLGSCVLSIWALWLKLIGKSIPGWASTVLPLYFIGGVQLLSIGILGEYLGKIYKEVKARPRYFKEEELK
jgi:glycosyltransferase involved in cell wall biosynthesis